MKRKSRLMNAWYILGFIGLVFGLVGFILVSCSSSFDQEANRLAQLPKLNATELRQGPSGQESIIEGRISERNRIQFQTFVAYRSELYQGQKCKKDDQGYERCEPVWVQAEQITPALWLDLPDGRVQLANTDYTLANLPITWQSTPQLEAGQTKRYSGFAMGNPIFALGTATGAGEQLQFKATLLGGGDANSYIAGQRDLARFTLYFGGIFILIGSLLMLVMGYGLVKKKRP